MSAHVLLNLLTELKKRDKIRSLPRIYLLDSVYQRTFKLFKNCIFGWENVEMLPYFSPRHNRRHYVTLLNL